MTRKFQRVTTIRNATYDPLLFGPGFTNRARDVFLVVLIATNLDPFGTLGHTQW